MTTETTCGSKCECYELACGNGDVNSCYMYEKECGVSTTPETTSPDMTTETTCGSKCECYELACGNGDVNSCYMYEKECGVSTTPETTSTPQTTSTPLITSCSNECDCMQQMCDAQKDPNHESCKAAARACGHSSTPPETSTTPTTSTTPVTTSTPEQCCAVTI